MIDHVTWLRTLLGDRIQIYEGVDPLASSLAPMAGWLAVHDPRDRRRCGSACVPELAAARRLRTRSFRLQTMKHGLRLGHQRSLRLRGLELGPVPPGIELGAAIALRARCGSRSAMGVSASSTRRACEGKHDPVWDTGGDCTSALAGRKFVRR